MLSHIVTYRIEHVLPLNIEENINAKMVFNYIYIISLGFRGALTTKFVYCEVQFHFHIQWPTKS